MYVLNLAFHNDNEKRREKLDKPCKKLPIDNSNWVHWSKD